MQNKCYDFSGIKIGIKCKRELADTDNLRMFRTDCRMPDYTVNVEFRESLQGICELLTSQGMEPFCKKTTITRGHPEQAFVYSGFSANTCNMYALKLYEEAFDISSVFRHMPLSHLLLQKNAIVLHASYVLVNGEAIAFCAPSGTGKSTQAELWKAYRNAKIVNGDRVLLRSGENGYTAGGIYYSGTSDYCENITAPLRAIVLLGQSEENSVNDCTGAEAFRRLLREVNYSAEFVDDPMKTAELLAELINSTQIVKLDCLPDETAVDALEAYLGRDITYGKPTC